MVLLQRCGSGGRLARVAFACCRLQSTSTKLEGESEKIADSLRDCVTSINRLTRERTILRFQPLNAKCPRTRGIGELPEEAIEGLKNALVGCSFSPKQLQHEADQLNEKLSQRHFPASPEEVREARRRVHAQLAAEDRDEANEQFLDDKLKKEIEHSRSRDALKLLKRTRYNWRPMEFNSRESAAAYALARLAPNYAEIRQVLREFERVNFVPKSVLDYGSGSGAAFWAANDAWGREVEEYQLVDPSDEINKFAMDVMRGKGEDPSRAVVHQKALFRRHLAGSPKNTFDLVIAHRVLIELASRDTRLNLVSSLWNRTNKFLVLIDSALEDSFRAIMEARDFVLLSGCELHADDTRELLSTHGLWNEESKQILTDTNISHFERFSLIREMLPEDAVLPTRLPSGFVFAPCPHDQGCPKISSKYGTCKFATHWSDLRADGKRTARDDGTSTDSFSYVILQKGFRTDSPTSFRVTKQGDRIPVQHPARILENQRHGKLVTLTVCTPNIGLQQFVVSKRLKNTFQVCKSRKAGDLLPLKLKSVDSESDFDVYQEAVEKFYEERQSPSH